MKKWFVIGIGIVIVIALVCGIISINHVRNNTNEAEVAEVYIPTDEEMMVWYECFRHGSDYGVYYHEYLVGNHEVSVVIDPELTNDDWIYYTVYLNGVIQRGGMADRDYTTSLYYRYN